VQIHYSECEKNVSFESQMLQEIIKRQGISRKYYLEDRLVQMKPSQVLPFFILENYLEETFFKNKQTLQEKDKKLKRFLSALEFLCKNVKKDSNI
jgi:hypothetical protein